MCRLLLTAAARIAVVALSSMLFIDQFTCVFAGASPRLSTADDDKALEPSELLIVEDKVSSDDDSTPVMPRCTRDTCHSLYIYIYIFF